jgi:hypothetical protein
LLSQTPKKPRKRNVRFMRFWSNSVRMNLRQKVFLAYNTHEKPAHNWAGTLKIVAEERQKVKARA